MRGTSNRRDDSHGRHEDTLRADRDRTDLLGSRLDLSDDRRHRDDFLMPASKFRQ